jgi:hypothetical protein
MGLALVIAGCTASNETTESAPATEESEAAPASDDATLRWEDDKPVVTPVIVAIDRTQARNPQNGGSAVLLFTQTADAASRNLATCRETWTLMDTATVGEVRVGVRKSDDGGLEALRPLYWLTRDMSAPGASCEARLTAYDFPRAETIRRKYGLTTQGPHFVVARADETAAASIDLTGRSPAEIKQLVRYFRDGFAFERDIWDPARTAPERKRATLTAFFGPDFQESFVAALGFVSSPAARAGCRLGDLNDLACAS